MYFHDNAFIEENTEQISLYNNSVALYNNKRYFKYFLDIFEQPILKFFKLSLINLNLPINKL